MFANKIFRLGVTLGLSLGLFLPNAVNADNTLKPDGAEQDKNSVASALASAVQVSSGWDHTCALMINKGVKCWGSNWAGQLGDGTTIDRYTPVDVISLESGVSIISTGNAYTCALLSSGGVKCWGNNQTGKLGDGTAINRYTPVDVVSLGSGVSAISAGSEHACALMTSGDVKCWGSNGAGALGDGTVADKNTPVDVINLGGGVSAIASGFFHTCALMNNGGVKCWGRNSDGELGDGTRTNRYTPVEVAGLTSDVSTISVGGFHACALINSGGVKCWGSNSWGQRGDGSTTDTNTPVNVVGLGNGVAAISAGWKHTCALMNSGGVKCWGYNGNGQLGDETFTNRYTPVDVAGLVSGVFVVSPGGFHTCILMNRGEAKCFGYNFYGQLGDGTTMTRYAPVCVVGFYCIHIFLPNTTNNVLSSW